MILLDVTWGLLLMLPVAGILLQVLLRALEPISFLLLPLLPAQRETLQALKC